MRSAPSALPQNDVHAARDVASFVSPEIRTEQQDGAVFRTLLLLQPTLERTASKPDVAIAVLRTVRRIARKGSSQE